MARPLNGWHQQEAHASRNGVYYPRDQQPNQQPRLPSMATIISTTTTQGHTLANGRDGYTPKPGYYSEYTTPSPVQQAPPQLPTAISDPHSIPYRPDDRLSPAQSSTASDRSSEELQEILRMRHIAREQNQGHVPRIYQPHRRRRETFPQETIPEMTSAKAPQGFLGLNGGKPPMPPLPQQSQSSPTPQLTASPRQDSKSMSISNLLSDEPKNGGGKSKVPLTVPMPSLPQASEYRIKVRQQPFAARSCGFGERDRRVIDPPPIVQLTIDDPDQTPDEISRRIRHPFSVVHCSIWDESGTKDMSSMPEDFRQQRRLMGTLVASPFVGLDENGEEGCFFCFPDLSCRTPGSFSLKFALVVLDPTQMRPGTKSQIVATAMSEVFQVFNAKDFPGMKASTPLTKRLKEQGCLISIKKGNEKTSAAHGRDDSVEDDEDDDGEPKGRSRKKQKKSS